MALPLAPLPDRRRWTRALAAALAAVAGLGLILGADRELRAQWDARPAPLDPGPPTIGLGDAPDGTPARPRALAAPPGAAFPAWPRRPASCAVEVWAAGGRAWRVEVGGCAPALARPLAEAARGQPWPNGHVRGVVAVPAVQPPWGLGGLGLAALPGLAALGRRSRASAAERPPRDVALDPREAPAVRAGALARLLAVHRALGSPAADRELLVRCRAVPEFALAWVEAVRRDPTPERLALLVPDARDRFAGWAEVAREGVAWLVVDGAGRHPEDPRLAAALVDCLQLDERSAARAAAVRLGAIGDRAAIPELRRAEATLGGVARAAVDAIVARTDGPPPGAVAIAEPPPAAGALGPAEAPAVGGLSVGARAGRGAERASG